jgi:mannose/fructose/N-acetylgalactosamine-specific phosphotransferase system component IIB
MFVAYSPLLARIDDRLIHGQVVVGCCEPLGARRILLVEDSVAADPLQKKLYRAGVPPEVAVEFLHVVEVAARVEELDAAGDLDGVVVVVARARVMEGLRNEGVRFRCVQLGGAHLREGATELVDGFFLDKGDRSALWNLVESGTKVIIQPVSRSPEVRVDFDLLRGADR